MKISFGFEYSFTTLQFKFINCKYSLLSYLYSFYLILIFSTRHKNLQPSSFYCCHVLWATHVFLRHKVLTFLSEGYKLFKYHIIIFFYSSISEGNFSCQKFLSARKTKWLSTENCQNFYVASIFLFITWP